MLLVILAPDSDKFICAKSFLPRAKGSRVRLNFRSAVSLYFRSEKALLSGCSTSCSQYVAHLFQLQHCQKTGNETKRRLEEAQLDLDKAHTENSLLKEVPNLLAIPLHLAVVAVWRLAWLISDPEIAGSIPVFRAFF